MNFQLLHLGDSAITIEFGNEIDLTLNRRILAIHRAIRSDIASGVLSGLFESVPTFRSLTLHFDPCLLFAHDVEEMVRPYLKVIGDSVENVQIWEIPCCYGGEYGEDLANVAGLTGLTEAQVIDLHSSQTYDVFMLGFLPGFAFMGILDERLRLARLDTPRTAVPKGSVAIADQLTSVYPAQSPGGWHLIGRTPIDVFDIKNENPALFQAGDQVRFVPIETSEFETAELKVSR